MNNLKGWKVAVGKGGNVEDALRDLEDEVVSLLPQGFEPSGGIQVLPSGNLVFAHVEMTRYEWNDEAD